MYSHFGADPGNDVTFTVGTDPFVFQALPNAPVDAQLAMMQAAEDLPAAGPLSMMRAAVAYLEAVLTPASFQRFQERMAGGEHAIGITDLEEVVGWLLTTYSTKASDR